MNLHGRKRSKISGEFIGFQIAGLIHRFPLEEFGRHGGHGDGSLASEGLEGGTIDDLFSVLLGVFEPHSEHISAVGRSDGSDTIGVFHFTDILGLGEGFPRAVFKFVWHARTLA